MSGVIHHNGCKVDERSQQILTSLNVHGSEAAVDTLKADIEDIDQTRQINYRVENHIGIGNAGLVEQSDTKKHTNGAEMPVYRVTQAGFDFINRYDGQIKHAASAHDAIKSIQSMQSTVEFVHESQQKLESRLDDIEESTPDVNVESLSDAIDDIQDSVNPSENIVNDVMNLAESVREIESDQDKLESLSEDVDEFESDHEDLESRVESLEETVSDIEDDISEIKQWMEKKKSAKKKKRKPRRSR